MHHSNMTLAELLSTADHENNKVALCLYDRMLEERNEVVGALCTLLKEIHTSVEYDMQTLKQVFVDEIYFTEDMLFSYENKIGEKIMVYEKEHSQMPDEETREKMEREAFMEMANAFRREAFEKMSGDWLKRLASVKEIQAAENALKAAGVPLEEVEWPFIDGDCQHDSGFCDLAVLKADEHGLGG